MPVAIDTSVLIHAEKAGDFEHLLPDRRHAVGGKHASISVPRLQDSFASL